MTQPQVIPLYPGGTPEPDSFATIENGLRVIRNVTQPSLTAYLPDAAIATGTAVIVAPGGAYHFLAHEHEGTQVAAWLNAHGIAAFLLKYRLVQTGDDFAQVIGKNLSSPEVWESTIWPMIELEAADGCQAVRLVRSRAAEWGVNPRRIGLMGFSAGGHLTLNVALRHDAGSRPDFAAPIYPAPPKEAPVPEGAPPLFLLCAADDDMAWPVCTQYYSAWRKAGQSAELHIYAQGGHGFGMNRTGLPSDGWIERFGDWLKAQGF